MNLWGTSSIQTAERSIISQLVRKNSHDLQSGAFYLLESKNINVAWGQLAVQWFHSVLRNNLDLEVLFRSLATKILKLDSLGFNILNPLPWFQQNFIGIWMGGDMAGWKSLELHSHVKTWELGNIVPGLFYLKSSRFYRNQTYLSRLCFCLLNEGWSDCSHKYKNNQGVMVGGRQPSVEEDLWWK